MGTQMAKIKILAVRAYSRGLINNFCSSMGAFFWVDIHVHAGFRRKYPWKSCRNSKEIIFHAENVKLFLMYIGAIIMTNIPPTQ